MSVRLLRRAGVLSAVATAAVLAQMAANTPAQAVVSTPLPAQSPITRLEPTSGSHAYSSTTARPFWSLVAVRPFGTSDLDLSLFNSSDNFLASSNRGINSDGFADVDFVAIDSNAGRRPVGTYISRVFKFSGAVTWKYTVEFADPGKQLFAGSNTMSIASGHVADVADLSLAAGQTVTIKVDSHVIGQYPELFVMGSTSALDATVPAQQALAHGAAAQPSSNKVPATVTFTAPHAGFYGVVLVNKTVPPTGAIPPGGDFAVTVT